MPVPADQDGNPINAIASGDGRTYEFDLRMERGFLLVSSASTPL